MDDQYAENNVVYWSRIKEILDGFNGPLGRAPGQKPSSWDSPVSTGETPQELAESVLSGIRAIEPGVPGRETQFVRSLARSVGTWGRMPLRGPFLAEEEIDEIVSWIDAGMPEGPAESSRQPTTDTAAETTG